MICIDSIHCNNKASLSLFGNYVSSFTIDKLLIFLSDYEIGQISCRNNGILNQN